MSSFGENIEGCKLFFHLGPNFCHKMLANLKCVRRHWCLQQSTCLLNMLLTYSSVSTVSPVRRSSCLIWYRSLLGNLVYTNMRIQRKTALPRSVLSLSWNNFTIPSTNLKLFFSASVFRAVFPYSIHFLNSITLFDNNLLESLGGSPRCVLCN